MGCLLGRVYYGSDGSEPTSRSRLLLDQRTPAELEMSIEAKQKRRRIWGIIIGSIVFLILAGGIMFYLFVYENILSADEVEPWSLNNISLAPGFKIEEYVKGNEANKMYKPRSLHVSYYDTATIIYVGSATAFVYALIDFQSDGINDAIYQIWQSTQSFATYSITVNEEQQMLYIDDMNGNIWRCPNVHDQVLNFSGAPDQRLSDCEIWINVPFAGNNNPHNTHYMNINPTDNNLCIAFGITNNIALPQPGSVQGTIRCFNGYDVESVNNTTIYAKGIRNSVGFEFHPLVPNQLWFTDCGLDFLDNNSPDDEINNVTQIGQHFGFPYCHTKGFGLPQLRTVGGTENIPDLTYGGEINNTCYEDEYFPGYQPLGPHVQSFGMKFIFTEKLRDGIPNRFILVAQHGSNETQRTELIGYRIMMITLFGGNFDQIVDYNVFAEGWLDEETQEYYGRPVDVEWLQHRNGDESFIVSDDYGDVIYRIYYDPDDDVAEI